MALSLCLGFLLPVFSNVKFKDKTSAASLEPLEVIIETDINSMSGTLRNDAQNGLGQTPFDEEEKKLMDGYSITPLSDSKNQISGRTYNVNEFTLDREKSVFIWVYFPDHPLDNFYDLTITFANNFGEKISWEFDYDRLYDMMYPMHLAYNYYGWKQLELVFYDGLKNFSESSSKSFSVLEISYKKNADIPFEETNTNGTLSIYGAFTHERIGEETNISSARDYAYYEFNPTFISTLQNLYTGSSYKLTSKTDIFSYIYVGKKNLILNSAQNNMFDLSISCTNYTF